MRFAVTVTGRRLSDCNPFRLDVECEARTDAEAMRFVDTEFCWEDAATRHFDIRAQDGEPRGSGEAGRTRLH